MAADAVPYAMFTAAEMQRRYARARELMRPRGIDALLISGEENFQYFAGTSASIALHHSAGYRTVGIREKIARRNGIWHDTVLIERRAAQG